jgi:mannitol 2-dehydrogenase
MSNVVPLRRNVAVPLNDATLRMQCDTVRVPQYDRSTLTPRIVHIGVGNFHRAHQAVYFDDLASSGVSSECGVTGVSLRSRHIKDALSSQDGLYTVVQRGIEGDQARVVGSLRRCLYAGDEADAVVAALADEQTQIVSLTITGNAYLLDPHSGEFDAADADVVDDLHASGNFKTTWAYLTEALNRRRRSGFPPFTVLSCDNMSDSGKAARTALVSFAALRDGSLANWIDRNAAFPSSMVDRITPKTGQAEVEFVERSFHIADKSPVLAEPYRHWVIEDTFVDGRPPLEEAGVEFVADVTRHKQVKTRILNGTHLAIAYLATLSGHQHVYEAMNDPVLSRYAEHLMLDEIAPLLPAVPGLDIPDYCATVLQRLSNPRISDQLSRLAARGSVKMPTYLLPSLTEAIARGRPHALLMLAVAGWVRYLYGYDLRGVGISIEDPEAGLLTTLATAGKNDPGPLLRHEAFREMRFVPHFRQHLGELIGEIEQHGVGRALRRHMCGDFKELMWR